MITQAGQLAQDINQSAAGIAQVGTNVTSQTGVVVSQINQFASQIASINQRFRTNSQAQQDESLDTDLHNSLEGLSSLANISVIRAGDGSYNVYLGGQVPLVLGDQVTAVTAGNVSGQTTINDAQGNDVTSQINGGQLGALIQEKNSTLPGYTTDLNTLAASLADNVNATLAGGVDQNGATPTTGLFTYDATNPSATLAVTNIIARSDRGGSFGLRARRERQCSGAIATRQCDRNQRLHVHAILRKLGIASRQRRLERPAG